MNTHYLSVALSLSLFSSAVLANDVVAERLSEYKAEGATVFDPQRGKEMWVQEYSQPVGKKARSCATCHTDDPTVMGMHDRTGKPIKPLAPAVNPKRLTSKKDIEKWFTRNCRWTVGRDCTPQEKGDILVYLSNLKGK